MIEILVNDKEFKPTPSKMLLPDGRNITGECWKEGIRFFLVQNTDGSEEVILSPGSGAYSPEFDNTARVVKTIKFKKGQEPVES